MNFYAALSEGALRRGTKEATIMALAGWSSHKIHAAIRYLRLGDTDESEDHVRDFDCGARHCVRGDQLAGRSRPDLLAWHSMLGWKITADSRC
jgi:hypothetical protein